MKTKKNKAEDKFKSFPEKGTSFLLTADTDPAITKDLMFVIPSGASQYQSAAQLVHSAKSFHTY